MINNSIYILLIVSSIFVIGTTPLSFSEPTSPQLFTDITASSPSKGAITGVSLDDELDKISKDPIFDKKVINAKLVDVDRTVLDLDEFEITLFNGDTLTVTKDSVRYIEDWNHHVWYGTTQYGTSVNISLYDDNRFTASIKTLHETYMIYSIDPLTQIFAQLDLSVIPNDHADFDVLSVQALGLTADSFGLDNLPQLAQDQIELLANSYIGGHNYQDDGLMVTIDVFVGYTTMADDELPQIENAIGDAIMDANRSYIRSGLPLELNLVGMEEMRGYSEVNRTTDVLNILNSDHDALDNFREDTVNSDADVGVLVVHYDNPNEGCGKASGVMVAQPDRSYAVVRNFCLSDTYYTLAHEIGHLQGAGHNQDMTTIGTIDYENEAFSFGHGSYWIEGNVRSMMSNDCDNDRDTLLCGRGDVWSDPFVNFQGSVQPSGTDDNEYNAKVLYATGPYIASLRGDVQSYDGTAPTADITYSLEDFIQGLLVTIKAIFSETVDDDYTPQITLTHSGGSDAYDMQKVTDTEYKADITLSDEVGEVVVSLSNARDTSGNEVVSTPKSGGSFDVKSSDTTKPQITLNNPEENPQIIEFGNIYTELGASAEDDIDGNITDSILIDSSAVNTAVIGTYSVMYSVSDSAGNEAIPKIRTVNVVATVPDTPIGLEVSATSPDTVTLDWTAPVNDGGSPIRGYQIYQESPIGADLTLVVDTNSTETTLTIQELSHGTTYNFSVFATNEIGISNSSNIVNATTSTISGQTSPAAPTGLRIVD